MNIAKLISNAAVLLRNLDLIKEIEARVNQVHHVTDGKGGSLPMIRTRINGRRVEIGPTPVKFLD